MFSYKQRHAVWQKVLSQGFFLPLLIFAVVLVGFITRTEQSSAATADTLNFQGRLLSSSGALVSDGSYNIAFTIYDDPTVGTNQWTETQSVTVQNGYFSVYLGSVNPFGSAVPWDQNLWMTMNVNGDGDMTPRFKLTAVPYAFRSGALVDASGNTKTADELAQLAPSTIQTVNAAVAALRLNQTGTGALLQLQGNGTDVFTVDKTGGTVLGAGITVGNSTGTTAGTIRWSGSDLEVYDGSGWLSLTSGGSGGGSSNTSASFVSGAINVAGTTTAAATGLLTATNTTAISWTAGSTTGFVAPADGSFRSCTVVGNANRTAGTLTLRWRVNGVSMGTGACVINATNPRTSSTTIDPGVVTFLAGDTITVAYDTSGLTPGGSTEYTTYWSVEYNSSATSSYFQDGGNDFGGTATLGTSAGTGDGLNIITNGATRVSISSTGDSTFNGLLTAGNGLTISSGGLDLNTTGITNAGTISGVTGIDGSGALTIQSGGTGDLTLDSSSDVLVLSDSTLRRTASGTTTLDLLDNTSDTTFSIQNSDGTYVAGLSVEGGITATSFTGDGSGLTDLNGNAITTGTVDDARLSTNVTLLGNSFNGASQLVQLDGSGNLPGLDGSALTNLSAGNLTGTLAALDGSALTNLNATNINSGTLSDSLLSPNVALLNASQTFTGEQTFSGGLVVGGGGTTTAGTIRWTGVDLELYDGSSWVSLTSGSGGGSGPLSVAFIQAYDNSGGTDLNTGTPTAVPWDSETNKDTGFTHSNVTNNTRIYLDDAGWYRISYNVSGLNQTANRNTVFCQIRMNGTTYNSPSGSYSYARNTTDSGTTNTSSVYVQTTSTNEYYEVLCSQSGSAGAQYSVAGGSWTIAEMTVTPSAGSGTSFEQGGNNFGGVAILGTSTGSGDGLSIITDGNTRITVSASGDTTFLGLVTISSGGLDLNTTGITNAGVISGVTSIDGPGALTIQSGGAGDLTLDSSSDVLVLSDSTLRRTASGTTTLDLLDNTSDTTFSIQNSDGTYVAGLSVEGDITANSLSGIGSGLTDLDGNAITTGTVDDARLSTNVTLLGNTFNGASELVQLDGSGLINDSLLSSNVALLNSTQTFSGTNTFNSGGVVLGQTTLSSSATIPRAISFPDESGTICLTDSDTCGYLRFASGIAQTDSSNNNTISINKTSASGSLIDLQRSGGAVFTVANSGALQIQSTSSTALDIRNGSGNSYFIVDTNTGLVQVGPGVADATGILFVLDTKNTTGDPTGIDGGIYYNSADGKNRCYENGYWSDCSTTRVLGENTITSANTTITVNLAESTEYLHCRVNATGRSANAFPIIRFNGDSGGASYGWNTYGITGTTVIDSQDSSDSEIQLSGTATSNIPFSANLYISNTVGVNAGVDWTMAGIEPIGTQVNRFSGAGVWGNTSAITSVTFTLSGTATFNSGSYAWCEGRNIR